MVCETLTPSSSLLLYFCYSKAWLHGGDQSDMRIYWSLKSIPELSDLSLANRMKVYRIAYRESGGMSRSEVIYLGLAVGLGVMFGPLGIGFCVAIVMLPVNSRMVERMRPMILAVRYRLGLDLPNVCPPF